MSIFQQLTNGFAQFEAHNEAVLCVFLSSATFEAARNEKKFFDSFLFSSQNNMLGVLKGVKFYLNETDNIEFRSSKRIILMQLEVKLERKKKFKFIVEEQ